MERKFVVTTPSETINLDGDNRGDVVFTVANRSALAERVLVRAVPLGDTQAAWLTIGGEAEREFASGGSQQIIVSVNVPPGAAAGRYRFRLDLVSARRGGEDHVEGPAVSDPTPVVERVPLNAFWNADRGDNFTTATQAGEASAHAAGYQTQPRIEGYVFPDQRPGTVPLKLFWQADWADNFTTATRDGEVSALASGYERGRVEGYVFPTQQPDTVPLKLYWSQERHRQHRRRGLRDRGRLCLRARRGIRVQLTAVTAGGRWCRGPVPGGW